MQQLLGDAAGPNPDKKLLRELFSSAYPARSGWSWPLLERSPLRPSPTCRQDRRSGKSLCLHSQPFPLCVEHACLSSTGLLASTPFSPELGLLSQFSVKQPQALCLTRTLRQSLLVPLPVWRAGSQMYFILLLVEKCQGHVLMATSTPNLPPSRLFFVTDRHSGLRFLVGTGAEMSVFTVSRLSVPLPLQVTLCKQSTTPASRHLVPSPTLST